MSPPLFLFGTLCHSPLLDAVIGDTQHVTLENALLPGFTAGAVSGGFFPVISAQEAAVTDGVLLSGLTARDLEKLDFYQAIFECHLQPVTLSDGRVVQAYLPPEGRWQRAEPWDLGTWVETWGDISLRAAQEVMSYQGVKLPQEVAQMMTVIRARAASAIKAEASRHGARSLQGSVEVLDQERPYANFFAIDRFTLRHTLFDGTFSPVLDRSVFRAPDASLVLPYDPVRDRVVLVEQFRVGPLARGDRTKWQLEPVAGHIDPGEAPEEAARRETMEEAGLELRSLHPAGEVYPSPGNSAQFFYLFVGEADIPDLNGRTGGLQAEGEDIRTHVLSFDELMEMCDRFQLGNEPALVLAFWLARHRARLRANAGV